MIALAISKTIGFRVSAEDEARGVDLSEHREVAYVFTDEAPVEQDYLAGVARDVDAEEGKPVSV